MPKKILLADDSLTIQKVVELTFSDSDYDLVCVSNGQKALDRIRDDRPDMILADVVMPEKNGYEVCEAIKSNPATSRIPVMLLSGTFEPFDRERAERIGADAIVSKPFDSQQLIAQVEALLDRAPGAPAAARFPPEPVKSAASATGSAPHVGDAEEAPFDVGFSAEDFTASVRMPARALDPFEEEFGRGDVDSAIEAFEKSRPPSAGPEAGATSRAAEPTPSLAREDAAREPLPQWLGEEPEKSVEKPAGSAPEMPGEILFDTETEETVALVGPLPAPSAGLPQPVEEISPETVAMRLPSPEPPAPQSPSEAVMTESAAEVPRETLEPPAAEEEPTRDPGVAAATVPRELEMLAQTSSIPELTQMLSSVAKTAGGDLTDDQIEKLARRVVEKLSDRIVREIAWEVIPDMAEIVIKQRIKELEAGVE